MFLSQHHGLNLNLSLNKIVQKPLTMMKIGFGGGCHWCTEAVFQSLLGVEEVEQGWISSTGIHSTYSEAVIVHFDPTIIDLPTLITIHLLTHSSTSTHSLRGKYRSAIYYFSSAQAAIISSILKTQQKDFEKPIITKVLPFLTFKNNTEQYLNYFLKNPNKPFCKNYIHPKLQYLKKRFSTQIKDSF